MSFLPPLMAIWFSKKRWYRSRVTVVVSSLAPAPAAAVNAVSIENGAFFRPALWAAVMTTLLPGAVTPFHVCGSVASTVVPSRSFCAM